MTVRLRQAVLVARDLDAVAGRLRAELGLGTPYADPGVAAFGLRNAVFAIGDAFLEVVSPVETATAAGRHLDRRGGDGGYMLIFQLEDLDAARARAAALGIRTVWQLDLPDISATHLHPVDTGGAIVSLDRAQPTGSWRWGGPEWIGQAGTGAPGRLEGARLLVPDPDGVARRWAGVLGTDPGEGPLLRLGAGGRIAFGGGDGGLTEIELALPSAVRRGRVAVEIGGVRFALRDGP